MVAVLLLAASFPTSEAREPRVEVVGGVGKLLGGEEPLVNADLYQGIVYAKSAGLGRWSFRTPAGDVVALTGPLKDSSNKVIDAGTTVLVALACNGYFGNSGVVCDPRGVARVITPAAPITSTNQKLRLLTLVTSLAGSCSIPGANTVAVQLPCRPPLLACDEEAIAHDAIAALRSMNVDPAPFTHCSFVVPQNLGCGWAGLAELPGTRTWFRPDGSGIFDKGMYMQEILHNYGVWHAWSKGVESADASTAMGQGEACPSAPELWRLQWGNTVAELNAARLPVGKWLGWYTLPATFKFAKVPSA
ncbi:hypothetical protein HYH03_000573 [Edaphochlamys debaryana]|uniref:Peptidase M11 gametolysin domain-containing protein n=1 Tax=Edaphochlamys debaryana TaxID=47281 RepID=A0A835YGE8_9CHLO|nr:hypothetical protein HYH03_000573 [Edaphochlamys debaryana]|eukprot:KAG2502081.1 hypothetical protein HYH03_000573 [Edaphochlamys debaryana]